MADSFRENAVIIKQTKVASDVYSMWLQTKEIAAKAEPGQFISVYSNDGSRLLPRPISVCETDGSKLRIVYRIAGKGTYEFSRYQSNEILSIQGPLGNGYPLSRKKAVLLGGGIGIPPMLELAKRLKGDKNIVLGYRDELFLNEEFEKYGTVTIATENGKTGVKGTVLDAIKEKDIDGQIIYACGPTPMLRAVQVFAEEYNVDAYLSLEEKMACGIGACLACVCKSKETDEHTKVNNKRVCKEGPVFHAKEIEF